MSRIAGRAPGFTLVELLIVVVLAGLVGATVVNLFRYQTRIFRSENQSVQLDQNLRAGMDLMVRELRNAGMKDRLYAYGTLPGILSADSSSVRFTADFHSTDDPEGGSDGDALDGNEDVEYTFTPVDSTLRRRTRGTAGDSGAQPMAEYVTRVRFTYLDAAGDTLGFPISGAALGTIRRIGIALQGAAPDGQSATRLESDVVPRNLGL
ncbi:MAG: prepilin-type N-terminal cleavage/methylation domain-containing protein [Gemmatimonadota bacterium]